MAISPGLDPSHTERSLTTWLQARHPGGTATNVSVAPASGGSHETLFFTANWTEHGTAQSERLVARIAPVGPTLFPHYDLEREFTLMKAVSERSNLPVPAVQSYEKAPTYIGSPFITMRFVSGHAPGDDPPFTAQGRFHELTAEQQATICDNALRTISQVHSIDPDSLGLQFLEDDPDGRVGVARQVAVLRRFYEWAAEGESYPTTEVALEWASAHTPSTARRTLVWGDARPANLIVADDLTVAATLDRELACIGAPEFDLAWWLFMNNHHTTGFGLPRPPGMPRRRGHRAPLRAAHRSPRGSAKSR